MGESVRMCGKSEEKCADDWSFHTRWFFRKKKKIGEILRWKRGCRGFPDCRFGNETAFPIFMRHVGAMSSPLLKNGDVASRNAEKFEMKRKVQEVPEPFFREKCASDSERFQ